MPKIVLVALVVFSSLALSGEHESVADILKSVTDVHNACIPRLGRAGKTEAYFTQKLAQIDEAIARNQVRKPRASSRAQMLAELTRIIQGRFSFQGNPRNVPRTDGKQVHEVTYQEMAAPPAFATKLAERILSKFEKPELFVDQDGKPRPYFIFQHADTRTPIGVHLGDITVFLGGHSGELVSDLVYMLSDNGDLKGLSNEFREAKVTRIVLGEDLSQFDLFFRTYFPTQYEKALLREKDYFAKVIEDSKTCAVADKAIRTTMTSTQTLVQSVRGNSGRASEGGIQRLKGYEAEYRAFMEKNDRLPHLPQTHR